MKILYLIPARAGSKGIKDKNILSLTPGGPTLLERAYAFSSHHMDDSIDARIVVSTDYHADTLGIIPAKIIHARPQRLCQDDTRMIDVVRYELSENDADIVVLLQPTSPFRLLSDLSTAITKVLGGATTAIAAIDKPHTHPAKLLTPEGRWAFPPLHPFANRQEWTEYHEQVGTFYVAKADHIRKGGDWLTHDTAVVTVPPECGINIDDKFDLWLAERVAKEYGI